MQEVFDLLNKLSIEYKVFEHVAVFTCLEAERLNLGGFGVECKNLFLKGNNCYYLVVLEDKKRLNFKVLKRLLNDNSLTFASDVELKRILNLFPGSVTPFGIINDKKNVVKIIFDEELIGKKLLVHPNINTATLLISYDDLVKIVRYLNHSYINMEIKKET